MANRSKFSSAFKSKVALEALKERETLAELSTRFEVSQEMISRWKGEFLKLSTVVFDNKQALRQARDSELRPRKSVYVKGLGWVLAIVKIDGSEIKISMDGKSRATDNTWIERFWRTIKRGYVYLHPAQNGVELYRGVRNYIEYYNYSKGHTAHNGLPPCVAYGVYRTFNVESSKKALHYTKPPQFGNKLQIN